MAPRLGELLVKSNLITPEQLQHAIRSSKEGGTRLGANLVKLKYIDETQLTQFLSKQYGVPAINLDEFEVDPEVVKLLPQDVAKKHTCLPVSRSGANLIVAMADPSNYFAIDDIKFLTGYNVEPVVASEEAIAASIEKYYAVPEEDAFAGYGEDDIDDLYADFDDTEYDYAPGEEDDQNDLKAAEDAPVVRLVNMILTDAIKKGASDIHIEPYEKAFRVRFRIDGKLYEVMKPPMKLRNAILSRIKIMSNLDIAERRLPQDGRIKLKMGRGREMDFRVSVCPTLFGEKACLRLLDKNNLQLDMTKLGFEQSQLDVFKHAIHQPVGLVLVTGPTGSGKTNTLYSAMADLNQPGENISTAEDPVEFNLMGINQVNMKEDIGLNFAATLRSFLRQDPDIIMVGEIRDFETAEIAIKASLTGHMVLSTLHTNSAVATINRLLNMGIEPFLVASACNAIQAQRLGRRPCSNCKKPTPVDRQVLLDLQVPADKIGTFELMTGEGCEVCNNTGYKGRVGIIEVLAVNENVGEHILAGSTNAEIKKAAIDDGFLTLRMSAIIHMMNGICTPDEVVRNTVPD